MQHRHIVTERAAEAIHRLRREGDLGNQHNGRLVTLLQHGAQHFDVHQRLAAAGDTVQQKHLPRITGEDGADDLVLRRTWIGGRQRTGAIGERVALLHLVTDLHQAALGHRGEYAGAAVGLCAQRLEWSGPALRFEQVVHHALLLRASERLLALQQRW